MNLSVKVGPLDLKNPLLTASGTFGYGTEFGFVNAAELYAGIIGKSITPEPRLGNETPRVAETPSGMLNAIGLQNPGVEEYCLSYLPKLRELSDVNIVNVAGKCTSDFVRVVERLEDEDGIAAYELNLSCPNVEKDGRNIATECVLTYEAVAAVRKLTKRPLISKLTPNVTDIVSIARAAVDAGTDALSAINTPLGMAVDYRTRKPILSNVYGGLSGPAVKPIALRCVHQIASALSAPIIGIGGIMTAADVLEFLCAGASAVQVGTANFLRPGVVKTILDDLERILTQQKVSDVREYIRAGVGGG
ncbi:MAG: dihydroorotate dehydrogenase [Planctomycetes bacterium]|nr:dihydroorotate dehydrogenase [Planctomycetota bacterium]